VELAPRRGSAFEFNGSSAGTELIDVQAALELKQGDLIVVSARRSVLMDAEHQIGPEVDDPALLAVPMKTVSVVSRAGGSTARRLAELGMDRPGARVYLGPSSVAWLQIPREPWTVLERGDILRIVGAPDDVERAAQLAGFVERDLAPHDLTFLAAGICAGICSGW